MVPGTGTWGGVQSVRPVVKRMIGAETTSTYSQTSVCPSVCLSARFPMSIQLSRNCNGCRHRACGCVQSVRLSFCSLSHVYSTV
ncbi:hypothetical protein AVEN_253036-1 [Araneus ventricosus]|uniref:Uncharacterized protein n=1 Tax=Araneus ventricosus TaxID=182803 RepID=A0A4Y2H8M0_ARAVE|nr:hypothetical protein AVEN_253036-1 [Araneus ventricosus]